MTKYKMFTFETEDSTTRLSISLMTVGFYTIKMITITAQNFSDDGFSAYNGNWYRNADGNSAITTLITENGNGMSLKYGSHLGKQWKFSMEYI